MSEWTELKYAIQQGGCSMSLGLTWQSLTN